jgi:hypothetical protein
MDDHRSSRLGIRHIHFEQVRLPHASHGLHGLTGLDLIKSR